MPWKLQKSLLGQRLLVGLLIVAVASAFRLLFFNELGRGLPYLLYYPATMLAALYGGLSTGLLAAALSAILTYFWVQQGELSPTERLGFLVFVISCLAITIVCELLRRMRKKVDDVNRDLQSEVVGHKHTAKILTDSELRYRRLFEAAKDGILILDARTGMVVDVNPFMVHLLGVTREVFLNKKVWELGFFKDLVANEANFAELQQKEYIRYEDMALEGCDGRRHEVEFISNVYLVDDHKVIQCNIRDITTRKRAEDALRESENKFRSLYAAMSDGMALHELVYDPAGHPVDYVLQDANPAFERHTGLRREAVIGRRASEIYGGDIPYLDIYADVAATGSPRHFETTYDPMKKTFSISVFTPQKAHFVTVFADITDRKQAEAEKEKLQAQLTQAQKMESVGRLAGGVAHDFNNMLMVIMGNVELSKMKIDAGHPLHKYLDGISKGAQHAATLTRQLLTFARKQIIAPEILNINNAIAEMLKLLPRLIGEDIAVVWRPGAVLGLVKIDPSQIDQILTNMTVNARDAIKGTGTITIETANVTLDSSDCAQLAEVKPGNYVMLTFSDTGCGMDPEARAHIFEPFFTTKDVGKGTGLGMAMVYGIVRQNNGYINVFSEPGQGTQFRIYLPCVLNQSVLPATEETPAAGSGGSETILLVEDEESVRVVAHEFLASLGYTVLVAENPEKALRLAAEHPGEIHLLLTDVIMPGMNGRDLSLHLAETRPAIKCLFISGFDANVLSQRGILATGLAFLPKPFTRDKLAGKVREVLNA